MTAEGGNPGWAEAAVGFIVARLPREQGGDWSDHAITAWQLGCEALAALGQAELTRWGAKPLESPALPDVLPRSDDICCAVLALAQQYNELDDRDAEGRAEPQRVVGGFKELGVSVQADGTRVASREYVAQSLHSLPPASPPCQTSHRRMVSDRLVRQRTV